MTAPNPPTDPVSASPTATDRDAPAASAPLLGTPPGEDLADLWDRADALDDEGVGDLAQDLRDVLSRYDRTRCSSGHALDACGCRVNRILWNVRGEDIDEIVIHEPEMVHIEQMSDRSWWIGIYLGDEDRFGPLRWSGNFSCDSRGRMWFSPQDDDVTWGQDESHEERRSGNDLV